MNIKKFIAISVLAFLFGFSGNLSAQVMDFCEDVSSDGKPISPSTLFNIETAGGSLKVLVNLPYTLGSSQVMYDIYVVDPNGEEKFDVTIYQDTESDWTWFWKEIIFYNAGRYNVYVYDRDRNFITSGQVRIQYY
jgi:hypothetical protein